jgi:cephalosporin-C deacetylase-like acetyl esterase
VDNLKCLRAAAILCLLTAAPAGLFAQSKEPPKNEELEALQAHFEKVIGVRHDRVFSSITTIEQWERRSQQIRGALVKMLWADMPWPDTPPPATVTHRERHPAYTVENLVLETAPRLFSTANLYIPNAAPPFPVVLYQCGHANKNLFKRHGAWFAANGIAVLVMDNIEMGEIEFTHHGVYSRGWFHWYSRGFSPLAVELLNARRAIDYLASRPDLDRSRIGATGRSGGGMATFFLAALDSRIKASAPVSGTLSTTGWIKHRLSMAHCDCQYPVNSHGLLYSEIGALTAPRTQLLANAAADRGFPMDAFDEMVSKMREIYRLYKADDALRTAVAPGGHSDTEAIRLPVYSFFLREFLGIDTPLMTEGPVDEPPPEQLICFRNGLPIDERLTRIDEDLIPTRMTRVGPEGARRHLKAAELTNTLRAEVFRYFPDTPAPLRPEWSEAAISQNRRIRKVTFTSFDGLRVRATYSLPANATAAVRLPAILIVDHRKGIPVWGNEQPLERNQWGDRAVLIVETLDRGSRALEQNLRSFSDDDVLHHMKRQAMVAGTTLESMQLYEVLRSLDLLRSLAEVDPARITIVGKGEDGVNGMYAALLDGNAPRVILQSPPASHVQGPHYLGVLRYTDIPETAALIGDRLRIYGEVPDALRSASVCRSLVECLR